MLLRRIIKSCWAFLAELVDRAMSVYLSETNPKHVVLLFIFVNLIVGIAAWLLTITWGEWYTASGWWVSATGFLVAISELYRARTATELVRQKLEESAREQRAKFYRFCLERALQSVKETQIHVRNYDWKLASLRLSDLLEGLSQIDKLGQTADDRWIRLREAISVWLTRFEAAKSRSKLSTPVEDWQLVYQNAVSQLNAELAMLQ